MNRFRQWTIACVVGMTTTPLLAQSSPWLPVPKTGSVTVIQVSQNADRFYRGSSAIGIPFGELEQNTTWLSVAYGATDALAVDARIGRSVVDAGPVGEDKGPTDMTVGVTWRLLDEATDPGMPSFAVRLGLVRAGDYDVGRPNAIGDGGDGYEASLLVGKIIAEQFALSADLGIRSLNNDVPQQTLFTATAHWVTPIPALSVRAQYHQQRSDGDLDIGGSGFSPPRFPEVTEDIDRVSVGATFSQGPFSIGVDRFNTTGARNTGDFDAWAVSVGYHFDLYRP